MKKLAILMCAMCVAVSAANAAETSQTTTAVTTETKPAVETPKTNEGIQQPTVREELIKMKKAREAAFEQKLGLTDEQKIKAKEIRLEGHKKMKPIVEQIFAKKQEAKMVKMSRMAVQMQEEKLAVIDKEIADLEKQANEIRKQNMKQFESILTRDQRKILKQMKKEGRERFEQQRKSRPCPPPNQEKVVPPEAEK